MTMQSAPLSPNPLVTFLPLLILTVPLIFVIWKLSKGKGLNTVLWTVLACIPFVNMIILPYVVGTPSKTLENKVNRILELIENPNQK
jgi:hypothetical protein